MYNPQIDGRLQKFNFSIKTDIQTTHTTHRQRDRLYAVT
jgi:hypothetical protein